MRKLTDSRIGQPFTVSVSDWTVINTRVGVVVNAQPIESYLSRMLPTYPDLLASCKLWQQETFDNMIIQSQALVTYARTAIADFTMLNDEIKVVVDNGEDVPLALQDKTVALLQKLSDNTAPLVSSFNIISGQLINFLNYNNAVDREIVVYKDKLGKFWSPIGSYIAMLENVTGILTGVWMAIADDLQAALTLSVDVNLAFLESLEIEAAIIDWQSVQAEAEEFPKLVGDQKEYWTKPV